MNREKTSHEIFEQLLESLNKGHRAALISKYNDSGISRSLVREDDEEAWNELERSKEGLIFKSNGSGLMMVEYYASKPHLIIFGGGHIALPLSHIGATLGFRITVFDDRPSFANEKRFPGADTVICASFDDVAEHIKINKSDYIIIVTRGHRHDSQCLRYALKSEARYLGMIGSRRRVAMVKKQMEEETGETKKLARLHAPIGLNIGAITPEEIAISILAEVIMDLRLGAPVSESAASASPWQFISPDTDVLEWLAGKSSQPSAVATVVETEGSTPRKTGAKMLILPQGQLIGSIGGGCAEAEVIRKAMDIIRDGGYYLMNIDLTDSAEEDGMVCGGTMKVLIEAV